MRPSVHLQSRDRAFLWALYNYDGVLAGRHTHEHFYTGTADSTFWNRLRQLQQNHFIAKPTREQMREHPVPETVYWLDVRGIAEIAAEQGIDIDVSRSTSQHAKKRLSERLRRAGIRWRPEPDWLRLKHHLAVCDVRFTVEAAFRDAGLSWEGWVPESIFRADPDEVTYTIERRGRGGRPVRSQQTRKVLPDGFFKVSHPSLSQPGKVERFAFLLEVDMRTEDNPRFVRDKILPGQAYLHADAYQERFGVRYGRWLVITTGPNRVANMKQAAERVTERPYFYFTSFDQLRPETFFAEPIWSLIGREEATRLLTPRR